MPRDATYELISEAANHCWSNKFLDVFRDFFAEHAHVFENAPQIMGEQDLEQYAVFQKYLRLYETHMSNYIESLDVSVEQFFFMLEDIRNDPKVHGDPKQKKLLHFINYLLASTDYPAFYKVMVRAAKKAASKRDSKAEAKGGSSDSIGLASASSKDAGGDDAGAKSDEKESASDAKSDYK